jgi:hypothetical protein
MLVRLLVGPSIGWSVRPLVTHITSKTGYVAIASRKGKGKRNQQMSKTGYVKIASRLVKVACSCFFQFSIIKYIPNTQNMNPNKEK